MLATILKSVAYGGTVTACGMVNGGELNTTVFPFIIRGVQLAGIDSAEYPIENRAAIWSKLGSEWKPANLEIFSEEIGFDQLQEKITVLLEGKAQGRYVLRMEP